MKIQESAENYLEAILILQQNKGSVRSIDIAHYLNFSKPSVSIAMKNLRNSDMITVDSDGFISLTEAGHKIADTIFERHTVLSNMLIKLGVPAEIAAEDACRMEHVISGNVLQGVQEFLKYGETYDRVVRDVDLRYLYPEGTYSFCMSLYHMEERFPRRLAEESEWFLEMAELIVSDKESFFILHGKEIEKDCRLWYLDGEKWRMAKREQNDFRLPQSALTCTVSAASPLTECDGVLGITEGIQKPEEAQCRELNIHIW